MLVKSEEEIEGDTTKGEKKKRERRATGRKRWQERKSGIATAERRGARKRGETRGKRKKDRSRS